MTFLDRIAESRLSRVNEARKLVPVEQLLDRCVALPGAKDPLARLRAWPPDRRAVIAEIKRCSPSRGPLSPDLDPDSLATAWTCTLGIPHRQPPLRISSHGLWFSISYRPSGAKAPRSSTRTTSSPTAASTSHR